MGRKSKHVILTDDEKKALERGYKQGSNPVFRRHCEAILMNASGKSIKAISGHFSLRVHTVGLWLQKWQALGIEGLKLAKGRGRKPKIRDADTVVLDRIENLLEEESRQLKHVLVVLEQEFAISMCKKTLKRFLRKKNTVGNVVVKSVQKSRTTH